MLRFLTYNLLKYASLFPPGNDTNYQLQNKASKCGNQTRRINLMQRGCMRRGNAQDLEDKERWKENLGKERRITEYFS